jgi:hypothetical protein
MKDKITIFVAMILCWPLSLYADHFNPFEVHPTFTLVGWTCRIELPDRAIKYKCAHYDWVYDLIMKARRARIYLDINLEELMGRKDGSHLSIRSILSLSNEDIVFDEEWVDTKSIHPCRRMGGMFYEYRCYVIKETGKQRVIWLTDEQENWLSVILKNEKVEEVRLNFSALTTSRSYVNFFKPYELIFHEFIEIFEPKSLN